MNNIKQSAAFTLIEILVAFAILTSAIIPIVTVMNHYGRESNWNEYYSFAVNIGSNSVNALDQIKLRKLKKAMGYDREVKFDTTVFDDQGRILLDLESIRHKRVEYRQTMTVRRFFPEFLKYSEGSAKPELHQSKKPMYLFYLVIFWKGSNNRRQEISFEYFRADL